MILLIHIHKTVFLSMDKNIFYFLKKNMKQILYYSLGGKKDKVGNTKNVKEKTRITGKR